MTFVTGHSEHYYIIVKSVQLQNPPDYRRRTSIPLKVYESKLNAKRVPLSGPTLRISAVDFVSGQRETNAVLQQT
jgi:hypothetical protein